MGNPVSPPFFNPFFIMIKYYYGSSCDLLLSCCHQFRSQSLLPTTNPGAKLSSFEENDSSSSESYDTLTTKYASIKVQGSLHLKHKLLQKKHCFKKPFCLLFRYKKAPDYVTTVSALISYSIEILEYV